MKIDAKIVEKSIQFFLMFHGIFDKLQLTQRGVKI
jgi:hypothetical protein